jgi:hypothetical protein
MGEPSDAADSPQRPAVWIIPWWRAADRQRSQSFGSLKGLGANEPRVLRADRLVIPEVPELFLPPR